MRLPGDLARSIDIDAPGYDLSQGQYFFETNKYPQINLLFTALFDLIICHTMKMGLLIPRKVTTSMPYSQRRFPRSRTTSARNGLLAPLEVTVGMSAHAAGGLIGRFFGPKKRINCCAAYSFLLRSTHCKKNLMHILKRL